MLVIVSITIYIVRNNSCNSNSNSNSKKIHIRRISVTTILYRRLSKILRNWGIFTKI